MDASQLEGMFYQAERLQVILSYNEGGEVLQHRLQAIEKMLSAGYLHEAGVPVNLPDMPAEVRDRLALIADLTREPDAVVPPELAVAHDMTAAVEDALLSRWMRHAI
ncbi:hypothetical protein ABZS35_02300 [Micromonospora sp. NPDC005599]|uniref:hypothetical protein n=1 Tax=unclassified Micromonospora TaxID=2617518 RepID=UPI00339F7365